MQKIRLTLLIIIFGLILSSFGFSYSKGLVTNNSTSKNIDYISNYPSLADNNAIIEFGKLLYIPFFIIFLIRGKKKASILDIILTLFIFCFQTVLYFSIIIDGCSLLKTCFVAWNFCLFFHIGFYINLFIILLLIILNVLKVKNGRK